MGSAAGVDIVQSAGTGIFFAEWHQKMQKRAIFGI